MPTDGEGLNTSKDKYDEQVEDDEGINLIPDLQQETQNEEEPDKTVNSQEKEVLNNPVDSETDAPENARSASDGDVVSVPATSEGAHLSTDVIITPYQEMNEHIPSELDAVQKQERPGGQMEPAGASWTTIVTGESQSIEETMIAVTEVTLQKNTEPITKDETSSPPVEIDGTALQNIENAAVDITSYYDDDAEAVLKTSE